MVMESLLILAIVVALLTVVVTCVLVVVVVWKSNKEAFPNAPYVFHTTTGGQGVDQINPTGSETTVPLEQFQPDFSKPIKIKIKDEDGQTSAEETQDA